MQRSDWQVIWYSLAIIANVMLSSLALQLALGKVPIPVEWSWMVPVIIAGTTALTAMLPKLGSEKPTLPPALTAADSVIRVHLTHEPAPRSPAVPTAEPFVDAKGEAPHA